MPTTSQMLWPLYCGSEASPDEKPGLEEPCCVFAAAAALLAAHLAFIVAANCARRSGVRLSFLFFFLATRDSLTADPGFTSPFNAERCFFFWIGAEAFEVLRAFSAGVADLALVLAAVDAASSFPFSLASFFVPFCRRASSRRILFLRFLTLAMWSEESLRRPPIEMRN